MDRRKLERDRMSAVWRTAAPIDRGAGAVVSGCQCTDLGGSADTVPCECATCGRTFAYDKGATLPVFDTVSRRMMFPPTTSGCVPFDFPPLVRGRDGKLTRANQFTLF